MERKEVMLNILLMNIKKIKYMKKAIINFINAIAERIRPCKHDWEFLSRDKLSNKLNPDYKWHIVIYRCKKCCESKKISTKDLTNI